MVLRTNAVFELYNVVLKMSTELRESSDILELTILGTGVFWLWLRIMPTTLGKFITCFLFVGYWFNSTTVLILLQGSPIIMYFGIFRRYLQTSVNSSQNSILSTTSVVLFFNSNRCWTRTIYGSGRRLPFAMETTVTKAILSGFNHNGSATVIFALRIFI